MSPGLHAFLYLVTRNESSHAEEEDECGPIKGPNFDPESDTFHVVVAAWIVTIVLAAGATLASFWLCFRHFQNYHNPVQQRQIVRIILMVPVYAICSTLSFRFIQYTVYIDIFRDCYEAFVLYSFYGLLTHYVGPTLEAQVERLRGKGRQKYPAPFCCWSYNPGGYAFLLNTRFLVMQYVIVRPFTTLLAMVLTPLNLLCPNSSSPRHGQFYVTYLNLISSTIAMYGLFTFYVVVHHDIASYKPLWKVIAVKFIIFFTFWQGIVLDALVAIGVIEGHSGYYSSENATDLIQSFLTCAEMVIAAGLHVKAFSAADFRVEGGQRTRVGPAMVDALSPLHILRDITAAPGDVRAQRRRRKEKKRNRILNEFGDAFEDKVSMVDVELEPMGGGGGGRRPMSAGRTESSPLRTNAVSFAGAAMVDIPSEDEDDDDEDSDDGSDPIANGSTMFRSSDPLFTSSRDRIHILTGSPTT
ncbi:organic solute transporter Ostalpha-domain-containing protein [Phlyctochytrium arcticum]|nr:organic solute transporter Ostalpha-domain-containing protein [Phlyctochytrium arcticum]